MVRLCAGPLSEIKNVGMYIVLRYEIYTFSIAWFFLPFC